ncbi:DUF4377 domain-containing protein [Cyclobacteriaceae bacterium YHN15]|jgi:hypothetical protein|nr:DUF4377 domain-containing protein [Cyclobacteriaceae bacterium YHN15]
MKPLAQLIPLMFSICLLFSCKQGDETPFELKRFWVYSSMVPCEVDVAISDDLCYLISETESPQNAKWELLRQPIQGFELEVGYFSQLEVKITSSPGLKPSSPPNITYKLNKTFSKIKDEAIKFSGMWKLGDLPGFDEKELIWDFPKYLIFDPRNRLLFTSHHCNSTYFHLEKITENELSISPGPISLKACYPEMGDYSPEVEDEFYKRIFFTKQYEFTEGHWYFKDGSGQVLIQISKINQIPKPKP